MTPPFVGWGAKMNGNVLDATLAKFDNLVSWMRNEGIHKLFIYDWNLCEWSGLEGKFSCLINDAPVIFRETWENSRDPFNSATLGVLKRKFPLHGDWGWIWLDSLKLDVNRNGWNCLVSVWIQTDEESLGSGVGEQACREFITTEGYIRWIGSEKSWEAKVEANTRVEYGALVYDPNAIGFY